MTTTGEGRRGPDNERGVVGRRRNRVRRQHARRTDAIAADRAGRLERRTERARGGRRGVRVRAGQRGGGGEGDGGREGEQPTGDPDRGRRGRGWPWKSLALSADGPRWMLNYRVQKWLRKSYISEGK